MRWVKENLTEKDYDAELLMLYLQRCFVQNNPEMLTQINL